MARSEFVETLYDSYGQRFSIDEVHFESRTEHQHLLIFQNARFGRVMALDGVVQTTERDEFYYHEMMAHVPLLAHGDARRVLIIGGGDGGLLREVVKHDRVELVTQVEIDASVVELARRWFPGHSRGAFDDPRLELVIADGAAFMRDSAATFDAILIDSTDPIGPGEVLFSSAFYRDCQRRLAPGGIMVNQNGVPFMQLDEVCKTARAFEQIFADWSFYGVAVPTYAGGIMTLGWASDDRSGREVPLEVLEQRFAAASLATHYYTPAVHKGAFALPRFVENAIGR
ncbi:MAG: polyamine aminopropyltransferase [Pseudomonadales bacterium]|jgi:spermidine synthase|nr:polyamine aminopropyltransferase [Pseudomonadales bacterium]